jgi:hypothetical protein
MKTKKMIENRTEQPNTFYIEEIDNRVRVVITYKSGLQHVDYPVQYIDGSFGYDFPERVPNCVKKALKERFCVKI